MYLIKQNLFTRWQSSNGKNSIAYAVAYISISSISFITLVKVKLIFYMRIDISQ
jgi:hypothetical protein